LWSNRFTIHAEHPAYAAKIVRSTLNGAKSEAVECVALLTLELVTDAMTDVESNPQLFVDVRAGCVYVEVRSTPSVDQDFKPLRLRQWTLAQLGAVTSCWGNDSQAVWFSLAW
jgi:hypothetical protein